MLYGAVATIIIGIVLIVMAVLARPHPAEPRNRTRTNVRRLLGAGAAVTVLGVAALTANLALGWWT